MSAATLPKWCVDCGGDMELVNEADWICTYCTEPGHRGGCVCADCSGAELTAGND